jgi:transposase-like protein
MSESILSAPHFHNEEAAYTFVESRIWPHGPVCPKCGVIGNSHKMAGKSTRLGVYKCRDCRKPFTVKIGTIFEASHIPMRIWLQAIYLVASSKKGVSSNQLHRALGVTLKSAWFMSHRIREAMRKNHDGLLGGQDKIVEADEAYFGTENNQTKKPGRGGAAFKQMNKIVSLVERNGEVRSYHVADVNGENLKEMLKSKIDPQTHVMTDSSPRYNAMKREKPFAKHSQVNHSKKEYARGEVTTNRVEGYFSIMKRGLIGTYHHVSSFHLQRYLDEFDFRFNNRIANGVDDQQRAQNILIGVKGKRLTYQTTAQ